MLQFKLKKIKLVQLLGKTDVENQVCSELYQMQLNQFQGK